MNLPRSTSSMPPVTCTQLEHGLTLIHQEMTVTDVVTVDVWVKAGTIAEPEHWSGMAHFLEHMIFKGSDRLRPGEFDLLIEGQGGHANAATSHDYAHFYLAVPAFAFTVTLDALAELLLRAAIPADEFVREREVVFEEMSRAYDDPDWVGFQALMQQVYQHHAYGRPVLGTIEHLQEMSDREMRQFHQTYYQPENMTVVVVGNIDAETAIAAVQKSFSEFPRATHLPGCSLEAEPPIIGIRRQTLVLPQVEEVRLMLAWLTPPLSLGQTGEAGLAPTLDLLGVLLTGGRSSRLMRELREERQLVHDIQASFTQQRDSGLFTITAWLAAEELDRVEAIICDRLIELMHSPVGKTELDRLKRLIINDYAFSTETTGQLAGLYGYNHTLSHWQIALDYPRYIQAVTPEAICNVASQVISPYHYAATIVRSD
ncbi:MAG: pitrilysin family protein [Synechococcales bacterium]|nr:pitrilysin family protein [Synechococcales bacterium]